MRHCAGHFTLDALASRIVAWLSCYPLHQFTSTVATHVEINGITEQGESICNIIHAISAAILRTTFFHYILFNGYFWISYKNIRICSPGSISQHANTDSDNGLTLNRQQAMMSRSLLKPVCVIWASRGSTTKARILYCLCLSPGLLHAKYVVLQIQKQMLL